MKLSLILSEANLIEAINQYICKDGYIVTGETISVSPEDNAISIEVERIQVYAEQAIKDNEFASKPGYVAHADNSVDETATLASESGPKKRTRRTKAQMQEARRVEAEGLENQVAADTAETAPVETESTPKPVAINDVLETAQTASQPKETAPEIFIDKSLEMPGENELNGGLPTDSLFAD